MGRISQLATLPEVDFDALDLLYIVDVSELDPDDRSKKATLGDLATYVTGLIPPPDPDPTFDSLTVLGLSDLQGGVTTSLLAATTVQTTQLELDIIAEALLQFGVDAVGVDQAAVGFTATVGRSTGNATPSPFLFRVGVQGASGATLQTATEAWRLQELANVSSREVAAMNVSGPVMGGVPLNMASLLTENQDGGRFANRLKVIRIASETQIQALRANGTFDVPTNILSAQSIGSFSFVGFNGTAAIPVGGLQGIAREDFTSLAAGFSVRLRAVDVGTTVVKPIVDFRGGGAAVAELLSDQATFRIIPGNVGLVIRDDANTFDANVFNGIGTAVYLAQAATSATVLVGSGTGSAGSALVVRRIAGQNGLVEFHTGNLRRWIVGSNSDPESGSDAGSNFRVAAYTDAGVLIDSAIAIPRAAGGIITTSRGITVTSGNLTLSSGRLNVTSSSVQSIIKHDTASATFGTVVANDNSNWALQARGFNGAKFGLFASNVTANGRNWVWEVTSGTTMQLFLYNDALAAGTEILTFTRSSTTPSSMTLQDSATFRTARIRGDAAWTLRLGVDASGTNVAANTHIFQGPRSTGNATPAGVDFQMTTVGASGSSLQPFTTVMSLRGAQVTFGVPVLFSAGFSVGSMTLTSAAAAVSAGQVALGNATQATVGAAGAASALPANPSGYLRFFLGSTEFVLPYYAQA